jgi:glycosyltransferase involved in cell wall biosynthesis
VVSWDTNEEMAGWLGNINGLFFLGSLIESVAPSMSTSRIQDQVRQWSPRIAFLRWNDDRAELSGMPWSMSKGLRSAGCEIDNVLLDCTPAGLRRSPLRIGVGRAPIRRSMRWLRRCSRRVIPDRTYRSSMMEMRAFAEIASRKIRSGRFDLVVAANMSGLVSKIDTPLPVIYVTDATATLANAVYPSFAERPRGERDAAVHFETAAVERADVVVVPSAYCRDSMCRDHGADPSRVHVVPLGANLVPNPETEQTHGLQELSVPTPGGEIELVVVAADPERKRVDLCAAVTETLESRGWRARLHYIGPRHDICGRRVVEWAGRLDHDVDSDRARHRDILRRAHLAILPSASEMYGIAPIESAAFGRPAIVSAVGGLTTVVEDGVTGRCLPVDTPVPGWADAIESMVVPTERYRAYSAAALHRYREEFNWGTWGRRVKELARGLV